MRALEAGNTRGKTSSPSHDNGIIAVLLLRAALQPQPRPDGDIRPDRPAAGGEGGAGDPGRDTPGGPGRQIPAPTQRRPPSQGAVDASSSRWASTPGTEGPFRGSIAEVPVVRQPAGRVACHWAVQPVIPIARLARSQKPGLAVEEQAMCSTGRAGAALRGGRACSERDVHDPPERQTRPGQARTRAHAGPVAWLAGAAGLAAGRTDLPAGPARSGTARPEPAAWRRRVICVHDSGGRGGRIARRAVHARYASTAAVAASSAAPTAIRAICQPGMPPMTTVCTGTGTGPWCTVWNTCPGGSGGCLLPQPGDTGGAGVPARSARDRRWQCGECGRGAEGQQGVGQPGQGGGETADVADGVHDGLPSARECFPSALLLTPACGEVALPRIGGQHGFTTDGVLVLRLAAMMRRWGMSLRPGCRRARPRCSMRWARI